MTPIDIAEAALAASPFADLTAEQQAAVLVHLAAGRICHDADVSIRDEATRIVSLAMLSGAKQVSLRIGQGTAAGVN